MFFLFCFLVFVCFVYFCFLFFCVVSKDFWGYRKSKRTAKEEFLGWGNRGEKKYNQKALSQDTISSLPQHPLRFQTLRATVAKKSNNQHYRHISSYLMLFVGLWFLICLKVLTCIP